MMSEGFYQKFSTDIRIILAIAWKDILDGWKNKVILTSVITSLFLIIFYTYMPELTRDDELPLMVILDLEEKINLDEIEDVANLNVRVVNSMDSFLFLLRDTETPSMGIIMDEGDFNSTDETHLAFQPHYPYWMRTSQIIELSSLAESSLSQFWNRAIEINNNGTIVYPVMDNYAYGKTFIATAGLLIQITVMGLSMAPQLVIEEKESRTLQAVMVSPANLSHFVLGKSIAVLFYTVLTSTLGLIFIGPLVINWGLTLSALLIGMFLMVTPGILLGVLFQTKQQLTIWIWVLFIPTILPLFFSVIRIFPEYIMRIIDWWPTVALSRLLRTGFTYAPQFSAYFFEGIYLISLSLLFLGLTIWSVRRQVLQGD
jgi:ABC-type transport system involved in cytochrome c biogenesis permease component